MTGRQITVSGARGTVTTLARPAQRVVSLVPSETEALFLLGAGSTVVGRTDYCVEPVGAVEGVPSVGGTKNADPERILALRPDLVLMNQEENTEAIYHALDGRVAVHLCFPVTVSDALALVRDLARLVGLDPLSLDVVTALETAVREAETRRAARSPVRVFCPIWMDPLMTLHGETFISDVLDLAGGANVFADRTRRYPLAADLGLRPAWDADRVGQRDVRYPRVTLDEVIARAPEVVLLPDEPHPFTDADAEVFRGLPIPAAATGRIHRMDGKDLSWYSPRLTEGIKRVARWLHPGRA